MINKSEISTEQLIYPDFLKNTITDEDLNSKLKQIKEVTNCHEEQGILILHDCNYNVEYAINKILTLNSQSDCEWKTKKGKQKKIQLKIKDSEKDDLNNNLKDNTAFVNNKSLKAENVLAINETSYIKQLSQDSYNNGKTFRNFNLSKKKIFGYIHENLHQQLKPSLIDLNYKWNGKSIIIENLNFVPMSNSDMSTIVEVKNKSIEKSTIISNDVIPKDDTNIESSIVFKTHCSTKPPPKVQYSLAAPVQIMNKNITHRSIPKLKFGDTDFYDKSRIESESPIKSTSSNNDSILQPSVINVEDNSIIKVGPSQKVFVDQSSPNFTINHNIYNQNSYFPQKSLTQPSPSNTKNTDFQKCNSANQYYDNYGYIDIHSQLPVGHTLPCNSAFQSLGSFTPSNINSIKDMGIHSKTPDVFINQNQSSTYQSQSNINHPKSTIYIVPNMIMNPMNGLYMTVTNPLPSSALSPPMASIQAQYNVPQPQIMSPQQHNQIYIDESQNQAADTSNRMKRPFNQTRQQLPINRTKQSYGDFSEEISSLKQVDISRGNFKGVSNYPPNQLSKQGPINYSVFINAPPNRSQLITNPLTTFPGHFQPQQHQHELSSFDNNRKRNMSIQSNNFSGKPWS